MKTAVLRKIENTWEPEMMAPEEALAFLDNKGIRYDVCDTPVPYSENKVSCGRPLDIGDYMIKEYRNLPRSVVRNHEVISIQALGDSMIEANIYEDDWLLLELGVLPSDGDIVMAGIDGEFLAKVFFTDDQNRKWLLPKNKNYTPTELTPDCEIRIAGVVHVMTKNLQRVSYNECMAILNRDKAKRQQQGDVFQRLAKAVSEGNLLFWASSSWAVVYCVARDCCGYEGSMKEFEQKAMNMTLPTTFEHVCTRGAVQRTISNHPYMRLHIDKWKENGASLREIVLKEFLRKLLL